jgi:hypothetical protein
MPEWNQTERGKMREDQFTTSYGDRSASGAGGGSGADWDGKSCSDFHQLPGRGIEDVESLTLLHGLGLQEMDEDESKS